MAIIQCEKGHLYDNANKNCPYCAKMESGKSYPASFVPIVVEESSVREGFLQKIKSVFIRKKGTNVNETSDTADLPGYVPGYVYMGPPPDYVMPDSILQSGQDADTHICTDIESGSVQNAEASDSASQKFSRITASSMPLSSGAVLAGGRYRVERTLDNHRTQGISYSAKDLVTQSDVQIVEYLPDGEMRWDKATERWHRYHYSGRPYQNEEWYARRTILAKEAAAVWKLGKIPGIAQIENVFYQNETLYVVSGPAVGMDLYKFISERGPLNAGECLKMLEPIMRSLSVLHQSSIFHTAINPYDIYLDEKLTAELMNVGVSVFNHNDLVYPIGSGPLRTSREYAFAALETLSDKTDDDNCKKRDIGPWTDVYSMCATFLYCITGEQTRPALERIISDYAPQWRLPSKLNEVLKKGLETRYVDRLQSMEQLRDQLFMAINL